MMRQDSSADSNRHSVTPPGKTKHNELSKRARKCSGNGSDVDGGEIVRRSPYVRRTAKRGSNFIKGGGISPSSVTQIVPSSAPLTKPQTDAPIRVGTSKMATTFVDSVASLCSKSIASCNAISEPVPREDIFLSLVKLCGIAEAKYWAEIMSFGHEKSYALLSKLL
jgi:hypothetical protein